MKTLLALCFITAGFAGIATSAHAEETTTTTTTTTHHRRHHHVMHHRHHHMSRHANTAQKPAAENAPTPQ